MTDVCAYCGEPVDQCITRGTAITVRWSGVELSEQAPARKASSGSVAEPTKEARRAEA